MPGLLPHRVSSAPSSTTVLWVHTAKAVGGAARRRVPPFNACATAPPKWNADGLWDWRQTPSAPVTGSQRGLQAGVQRAIWGTIYNDIYGIYGWSGFIRPDATTSRVGLSRSSDARRVRCGTAARHAISAALTCATWHAAASVPSAIAAGNPILGCHLGSKAIHV